MGISMKLANDLGIRTPLSLKTAIAAGIAVDERENDQVPITRDDGRRAQTLKGKVISQLPGSEHAMKNQLPNDAQQENEQSWGELGKFRPGDCEFKERELGKYRPGDSEFKGNAVSKGRLMRGRS
jgi:hypothetical protein